MTDKEKLLQEHIKKLDTMTGDVKRIEAEWQKYYKKYRNLT